MGASTERDDRENRNRLKSLISLHFQPKLLQISAGLFGPVG